TCADTSPTRNSPAGTRTKHRYPVLIRVLSDRQNAATGSTSQTTTNSFPPATLTALAKAIGHTEHGLTGGEIGQLLHQLNMFDPGEITKWKRLEASFTHSQNT
ncbi:hypothetical protein ACUY28_01395, partial [Corynebacterium sanguinis]